MNVAHACAILLILTFLPQHPDRFREQELYLLLFAWGMWSEWITRKARPLLPFFLWLGWSGLRICAGRTPLYAGGLWGNGSQALLSFMLIVTVMWTLSWRTRLIVLEAFQYAAILWAGLLIFSLPGALDATSVDSTMLAMLYPSLACLKPSARIHKAWLIWLVLAIFLARGATGVYCLVTGMVVLALYDMKRLRTVILTAAFSVAALAIGLYTQREGFTSSPGRTEPWALFYEWWRANANPLIGTGLGTFQFYAKGIQEHVGQTGGFFLYAHNDYLQLLLETGAIGLALGIFSAAYVLYRARHRPWIISTLCVTLVGALAQSPSRIYLMASWVAFVVGAALDYRDPNET